MPVCMAVEARIGLLLAPMWAGYVGSALVCRELRGLGVFVEAASRGCAGAGWWTSS